MMTRFLIRPALSLPKGIARGDGVVCLFEGLTIGYRAVGTLVARAASHKSKSKSPQRQFQTKTQRQRPLTTASCHTVHRYHFEIVPIILFIREMWWFVSPGLNSKERRYISGAFLFGLVLFAAGVVMAYVVVLPVSLRFFWNYSLGLGITPAWSIDNYFSFVLITLLAFGISFELPIVTTLLSYLNILNAKVLSKGRRYAIFAIVALAAVLTPDVISLFLMALPMLALYELAIVLSRWVCSRTNITNIETSVPN